MNKQMTRNSMARQSMARLRLQQKDQLRILSTLTWQALTSESLAEGICSSSHQS